jgi:hypothetical protein
MHRPVLVTHTNPPLLSSNPALFTPPPSRAQTAHPPMCACPHNEEPRRTSKPKISPLHALNTPIPPALHPPPTRHPLCLSPRTCPCASVCTAKNPMHEQRIPAPGSMKASATPSVALPESALPSEVDCENTGGGQGVEIQRGGSEHLARERTAVAGGLCGYRGGGGEDAGERWQAAR